MADDTTNPAVWARYLRPASTLTDLRGVVCHAGDLCVVPIDCLEGGEFEPVDGAHIEIHQHGRAWATPRPKPTPKPTPKPKPKKKKAKRVKSD